jgi:hypothetical protein
LELLGYSHEAGVYGRSRATSWWVPEAWGLPSKAKVFP